MKIVNISNPLYVAKANDRLLFGNSDIKDGVVRSDIRNIPNVVPDYMLSKPISYSKIEDINLPQGLVASVYKLANGQRVVIIPKKGETIVKTYVNTGSLNEPDKLRGISHYIEHNLFNGSEALGDKVFFDEVNKMGAQTNASTSFSVTDYYIQSQLLNDNDMEEKIKLHAGMLQTPKFLQEKLDKEKEIVNSEINMCLSNDASRAETLMLKNLFGIKSTSKDLVAGTTDNIDALTRDDVVNYFNNNYYPANMVTVITGEVEPNNAINLIAKYFNSTRASQAQRIYEKMEPTNKPIREDLISSKTQSSATVLLGFAGPENANNKDKIYLRAVNYLLAGLANSRIKPIENKYSTGISLSSERMGTRPYDRNALVISSKVPENYVEPLLKDIYGVLDNLSKRPPSEDEFIAIKNQIKKSNANSMQSSAALNYHIGMDFLNGVPHNRAEYASIIDNMTYDDFINTAKKYYNLNKVSLTVVHPVGTSEQTIKENYDKIKRNPPSLSFCGSINKTPIDLSQVEEYSLANNFDVILQNTNSDIVNYSLQIKAPDLKPKKAAVADVLYDMLQNCGTKSKTKSKMDSIYDKFAIDVGFAANENGISFNSGFLVKDTKLALQMFKEQISDIDLSEENFRLAVKHCKDVYSTKEPSAFDKYAKAIYTGTELSLTAQDKLDSLSSITLEDVKDFYNQILKNGQGSVVVTAPFSNNKTLKQEIFNLTSQFDLVKPKQIALKKSFIPIDKPQIHTVETKRNQAEIIEGFKFRRNGNIKDELCIEILESILGGSTSSRLFSDLRETRHLAYSVYAKNVNINDIGVMNLCIKTTTNNLETGKNSFDNIQKSIEAFNENVQKMMTQKVSQEELQTAKNTLKNKILSSVEMDLGKTLALSYSSKSPYGLNILNKKYNLIDSITPDDILNTAVNIFKSKPVYSVAACEDALKANETFLNSLQER